LALLFSLAAAWRNKDVYYTTEHSLKLIINAFFNALYFRNERAEQL